MKIEIDVTCVGQCPYWVDCDGTCEHDCGPVYCTNMATNKPSGHCPFLKTATKQYVWLNTDDGKFSNSWTEKEHELHRPDMLPDAKSTWKLIEYKCLTDKEFQFYKNMRLA